MKYEIYIERKVSTFPYENLTIGYTQSFDDAETPRDAGYMEVRSKLDEWVTLEVRRIGPKDPEPRERILISPKRPRDPILDMTDEHATRRRFR
jgi:hypothetical protein